MVQEARAKGGPAGARARQGEVEPDPVRLWRRRYPKATCVAPQILRNPEMRNFVDSCVPTMTLDEIARECAAQFGKCRGLNRSSIFLYVRDWCPGWRGRSRKLGKARHRRGKIRAVERDPGMVKRVLELARFAKARLIWELLAREMGAESVPRPRCIERHLKRLARGKPAIRPRATAIDLDDQLAERIGALFRWGGWRLIHAIVTVEFGDVAPKRPETIQEYILWRRGASGARIRRTGSKA